MEGRGREERGGKGRGGEGRDRGKRMRVRRGGIKRGGEGQVGRGMPHLCHSIPDSLSYDAHIHLYGYPFLDSKAEFTHNSIASDIMKPGKNDPPLTVVDLSSCTIGILRISTRSLRWFLHGDTHCCRPILIQNRYRLSSYFLSGFEVHATSKHAQIFESLIDQTTPEEFRSM